MKKILITLLLVCSLTGITSGWLSISGTGKRSKDLYIPRRQPHFTATYTTSEKLRARATEAKIFTQKNSYNQQVCLLVDMSLPSSQNRFFVYDLRRDTVQNMGLVTHGRCNENFLQGRKYGNTVGCGCTSLGKYRIGTAYQGRFGLAYKLYGLDKTNSRAFDRFVVLHSHGCVPETEVKEEICQSDGCPTVATGFLQQLKPIINYSKKPVLLWIYE